MAGDTGGAKSDNTSSDKKSGKVGSAEADKPKISGLDEKVAIDTAVTVEPPKTAESPNKKDEAGKAKSEAKEPEGGDEDDDNDDDDFEFEMDEDTFHFYQQAEVEAENKATEAQSKAIGSFCNIIFQILISALFVAKLNQVYEEREDDEQTEGTSSFSTFWILFPFLLISGCVISCFACAIFGAANIDTAMSSEDADESGGENNEGGEEAPETGNNEASPVILTPPPVQGVEGQSQKTSEESNAQVSNTAENAANNTPPAEAGGETDQESTMDDLD